MHTHAQGLFVAIRYAEESCVCLQDPEVCVCVCVYVYSSQEHVAMNGPCFRYTVLHTCLVIE
jgi:hypothetical protein